MTDNLDMIDRLGRRRALIAILFGVFFMASQMNRFGALQTGRLADLAGWAIFTLAMILFVLFGSGLWRGRWVRSMLNDESTAANRRTALIGGFWAVLLGTIVMYLRTYLEPVSAREALHTIVTFGVGLTIVQFGLLEWKAYRE